MGSVLSDRRGVAMVGAGGGASGGFGKAGGHQFLFSQHRQGCEEHGGPGAQEEGLYADFIRQGSEEQHAQGHQGRGDHCHYAENPAHIGFFDMALDHDHGRGVVIGHGNAENAHYEKIEPESARQAQGDRAEGHEDVRGHHGSHPVPEPSPGRDQQAAGHHPHRKDHLNGGEPPDFLAETPGRLKGREQGGGGDEYEEGADVDEKPDEKTVLLDVAETVDHVLEIGNSPAFGRFGPEGFFVGSDTQEAAEKRDGQGGGCRVDEEDGFDFHEGEKKTRKEGRCEAEG